MGMVRLAVASLVSFSCLGSLSALRHADTAQAQASRLSSKMPPVQLETAIQSTQDMHNNGDVAYTITIDVGGQPLQAVPDTGSFDLLVFGAECKSGCGPVGKLYDAKGSSTFSEGELYTMHAFGSGEARSIESYDNLTSGPAQASRQLFWQVFSADMPILQAGDFQAILGLGPPESSVKIAESDAEEVRRELAQIKKMTSVTKTQQKIADNYFALAKNAAQARSIHANFGLHSYSICLGRSRGSKGTLVWHDTAPQDRPATMFRTIPVEEGLFWSAKLESVQLGLLPGAGHDDSRTTIGCRDKPCTAIVDSGTSLIVAPTEAAWLVEMALQKWSSLSGNCKDLSTLPNLEFMMGGIPFSLPPESYVGDLSGDWSLLDPELQRYLPHLERKMASLRISGDEQLLGCTPLIMVMDSDAPGPAQWILGMPFFREYYTTFTLGQGKEEWRREAKTMSFALADSKCRPTSADELFREGQAHDEEHRMRVDISKLRVPHWLRRSRPKLSEA